MGKKRKPILTPSQTEGPFFPDFDIVEKDADMVSMKGRSSKATGEIVNVHGLVQDQTCEPVEGVVVELWQACHTGKYNHRSDPNQAELDPNFQYYAKVITDNKGRFQIRTIIPGSYPAASDWDRPPHFHFKFSLTGFEELTTQTYFKGHPLNQTDEILLALSPDERDSVMVDFVTTARDKVGELTITLRRL